MVVVVNVNVSGAAADVVAAGAANDNPVGADVEVVAAPNDGGAVEVAPNPKFVLVAAPNDGKVGAAVDVVVLVAVAPNKPPVGAKLGVAMDVGC